MRNSPGVRAVAKSSTVTIPQFGMDWSAVLNNVRQPLVITDSPVSARALCRQGVPAIAVEGLSKLELSAWLRARGANVIDKAGAN